MEERTWIGQGFPTTRWTLVSRANTGDEKVRSQALNDLCRQYWSPLYAFARRTGNSPEDAEDMTQGFLSRLLEREDLRNTAPNKGTLRSFLLSTFRNYIASEWRKRKAKKRGGTETAVSIDHLEAESRFSSLPSDERSPEKLFDRAWALVLLDHVLARLEESYRESGKESLFEKLRSSVTTSETESSYKETGEELGMSEGAVKMAVFRLRKDYRETLREMVGDTLTDGSDVDAELRALLAAWS